MRFRSQQTEPENQPVLLLPETVSERELPLNFIDTDLALFEHERQRVIPAARLLELRNIGVSADGIMFEGIRMRPESFAFPSNRESWKKRAVLKFFALNYLLKKRRMLSCDAVWVVDDWATGYFHWLADSLPRLLTIKDRLNDLTLLLPSRLKDLHFIQPTLKAFGVKETIFIEPDEVYFCKKLLVPTQTAPSGHYRESLIREVGKILLASYGAPTTERTDKIFISRDRARMRKLVNDAEVSSILREFGFQTIYAEDYSFEEQVKLASKTRYLVANHGAGLTNMLFMLPGGSVLELRHATDRINNCYFTLASALCHHYFYQKCEPQIESEDPHTANLIVDLSQLRRNVSGMLNATG